MILKFGNKEITKEDFPIVHFFNGERNYNLKLTPCQFQKIIQDYLENQFPLNPDSNDL